jgi:hypothetical protein
MASEMSAEVQPSSVNLAAAFPAAPLETACIVP